MTSYRCPVCGVADLTAFYRCDHPGCTDGRDTWPRAEAAKRDAAGPYEPSETAQVYTAGQHVR
jgi:hypothetical protein